MVAKISSCNLEQSFHQEWKQKLGRWDHHCYIPPCQHRCFRGSTGVPNGCFGAPNWLGQRHSGLEKYEPAFRPPKATLRDEDRRSGNRKPVISDAIAAVEGPDFGIDAVDGTVSRKILIFVPLRHNKDRIAGEL